jgi:hypothetical protein
MIEINVEWIQNTTRDKRRFHLDLSTSCILRGGRSAHFRGVLAQYLGTTFPGSNIYVCHACHNGECSNPLHLYWGSPTDNIADAIENGTHQSAHARMVAKYTPAECNEIYKRNAKRNFQESVKPQRGPGHSGFGKVWITNGVENKRLPKELQVPNGWSKGRTMK